MPRKKEKLLAIEVIETNSSWDYRPTRAFHNFICKETSADKMITDADLQENWKYDKEYSSNLKAILATPGTRNHSYVFYGSEVCVEEVKLPASVKPGTKYIYKVYDYTGGKLITDVGTQKDIISYLGKRIKTKYACVSSNGKSEKIEYSQKTIAEMLSGLEETTSQLQIEPVGRSADSDETMLISIFENRIK